MVINVFCFFRDNNRGPLSAFLNMNEKRWSNIEKTLQHLADRIAALNPNKTSSTSSTNSADIGKDIVVSADPKCPPYSLKFYVDALSKKHAIFTSVHVHSSLAKIPGHLMDFLGASSSTTERSQADLVITLIWKQGVHLPSLINDPRKPPILGEVNIGRYFARIIETGIVKTESLPPSQQAKLDEILDVVHGKDDVSDLLKTVAKKGFLVGNDLTIADVHLLSVCKQRGVANKLWDSYKQRCLKSKSTLSLCC